MSDSKALLSDTTQSHKNGKLPAGRAVFLLYRADMVWRGALDMVILGTLVLILAGGLPDLRSFFAQPAHNPVTPQTGLSPAPATHTPSPTFAPVDPAKNQNQPLQSKISPPKALKERDAPVWINHPSAEQTKELEKLVTLVGVDNTEIIRIAKPKAEEGDANYQFILAEAYANTFYQNPKDPESASHLDKALYWYKESANLGHPYSQFEVGQFYRLAVGGHIQRDIDEAIRWYEMAASNPLSKGNAENELGRIYESGQFKTQNPEKALSYYKAGAMKGYYMAQSNYAAMLYNGAGVKRNIPESIKWLTLAAKQDYPVAQHNLALAYKRGRVTGKPDYVSFLDWAHKSARQGFLPAMVDLGNFYRSGEGGEVDNKQAAIWFRQAALKKNPEGQFLFAEMYEQGLGVPQDYIQAYLYYSLAKQSGYAMATGSLNALKVKMSPAQLDYAEKMVRALSE